MQPPQRMIIITLTAVFLAAIAVGATLYFMNFKQSQDQEVLAPQNPEPGSVQGEVGFNTAILSQPNYTALDATLFSRGLLPVQPPGNAGKQNPFQ